MSQKVDAEALDSLNIVPQSSEIDRESFDSKLLNNDGFLERLAARVFQNPRALSIFFGVCEMSDFLIGAGILGLTSVFAAGGWLSGLILFLVFGFATWFSLDLLLESACNLNCFSYDGIGFAVGGWTLQMVSSPRSLAKIYIIQMECALLHLYFHF
jgi:hypothetical protein